MPDWPYFRSHKPVLSSVSEESAGSAVRSLGLGNGSAVWPVANTALYIPFSLSADYLVVQVWWHNGTTAIAGNVDCGVYSGDVGTPARLFSSGSTAQSGLGVPQSVTLATPYLLTPGSYYMALVSSSASAPFLRWATTVVGAAPFGAATQVTALPLPATATLAATTYAYTPLFGISSQAVI